MSGKISSNDSTGYSLVALIRVSADNTGEPWAALAEARGYLVGVDKKNNAQTTRDRRRCVKPSEMNGMKSPGG